MGRQSFIQQSWSAGRWRQGAGNGHRCAAAPAQGNRPAPRPVAPPPLSVVQGLLLDCDAATLTVWVNGGRKGVMVRPGMTFHSGEPVGRLEGPLRWAVDMGQASVAIAGPLPPPA